MGRELVEERVLINNEGGLDKGYVETLKVWEMSFMIIKSNITVARNDWYVKPNPNQIQS